MATRSTCAKKKPRVFRASQCARHARVLLSCVLAIAIALPLAGCRDSDVLTQKIVGAVDEYQVDYSLAPVRIESASASQNDQSEDEVDESDQEDEPEETDPGYDAEDSTTNDSADQRRETKTPWDGDATQGNDPSDGSNSSNISYTPTSGGDAEGTTAANTSSGTNTPQTGTTWNPATSGDADSQPSDPTDLNTPTIFSPSNNDYSELSVTSRKIAAAGPYATIVQALGGKGALGAAPQQWKDNLPATAFNSGAELEDVAWISEWGDGTTLSDAAVAAIIASGVDTILTSGTYGGVTEEQAQAFLDAGISVVGMPNIGVADASDENIVTTVEVIAALLKNAYEKGEIALDAQSQAAAWKSLHTQALNNTLSANGGYTVVQANGILYDFLYQGKASMGSNDQISYVSKNRFYMRYVDAMGQASLGTMSVFDFTNSVLNTEYMYADMLEIEINGNHIVFEQDAAGLEYSFDLSDGVGLAASVEEPNKYPVMSYYLQHAGVADAGGVLGGGRSADFVDTSVSGVQRSVAGTWDVVLTTNDIAQQSGSYYLLGDNNFPALMVRDVSVADAIASSASKLDTVNKTIGLWNTGHPYAIYVMPQGISGSWADGTFESFLMAPWAYCMYQVRNASGNIDLSSCDEYVNTFYQTFYRCSASGIVDGQGGYGVVYAATCPAG